MSEWRIAEAIQPQSALTGLDAYEASMNRDKDPIQVRVLRVPYNQATIQEREAVAEIVVSEYLGKRYPISVVRLWVYRFVNSLPWKIEGEWCTRLVWEPWERVCPRVFARIPDGEMKKNPTPRTFENRLIAGNVMDVTHSVIYWTPDGWHFYEDSIIAGDILCVRTYGPYGKIIRSILGSYTNHNGIMVKATGKALEATLP